MIRTEDAKPFILSYTNHKGRFVESHHETERSALFTARVAAFSGYMDKCTCFLFSRERDLECLFVTSTGEIVEGKPNPPEEDIDFPEDGLPF